MTCNSCGNENAYAMRFTSSGESCNKCGFDRRPKFSDVYFREPYLDPHLVDVNDHRQKDGVFISSREQKAQIMRRIGAHEAGDRVHGAR